MADVIHSFVPGGGEAMDIAVATGPGYTALERFAAGCSLAVNAAGAGCLPNLGPIIKSARLIGPAGDAAAKGLTRMERFMNLASGFHVGQSRFTIHPHTMNSLRKSGRRQIDPEALIRALHGSPVIGTPGSRVFTDPVSGVRFFVNDANEVIGAWPLHFK